MLTPLEIENKRFKKEVFGYSQVDVEDFLSEVSSQFEKIYKDNNAALARIEMLNDAIKQYKSMEETLQNAMAVAHKSGDEIRAHARSAADRTVSDAEKQAQQIVADAQRRANEISYKSEEIRKSVELFKKQNIELLMEQLEVIKKGHSISAPELETTISFAYSEVEESSENSAVASSETIDLSKVLADVGKISKNLDVQTSSEEMPGAELDIETEAELDEEPVGLKELFGDVEEDM
ncbi:MAG: DivIVA domain-containing protein [Oscillospiraceae bacterium]|nr:DivIVA domain-containing protein [Oscillospiraceae bacterium]